MTEVEEVMVMVVMVLVKKCHDGVGEQQGVLRVCIRREQSK